MSYREAVGPNPVAPHRPVAVYTSVPKVDIKATIDRTNGSLGGGLIGVLLVAAVEAGMEGHAQRTIESVREQSAPVVWDTLMEALDEGLRADGVTAAPVVLKFHPDAKTAGKTARAAHENEPVLILLPWVWLSPDLATVYVQVHAEGFTAGPKRTRWYRNSATSEVPTFLNLTFAPTKEYTEEGKQAFEGALQLAAREAVEMLRYDLSLPQPPPDAPDIATLKFPGQTIRQTETRVWIRWPNGLLRGEEAPLPTSTTP